MSNFGTLLEGLVTVRAFRAQKSFRDKCIDSVDTFQKMYVQSAAPPRSTDSSAFIGITSTGRYRLG